MNNIVPFSINPDFHIDPALLESVLKAQRHVPIGATQAKSTGFVDPVYHDTGVIDSKDSDGEPCVISHEDGIERKFVRRCGDALVFAFKVEKKAVPSVIVKQELLVRSAAYEKEVGFAPGRKWARDMKEEVVMDLLPKCFPSSSEVTAYLDIKNKFLVVGTASLGVAEDLAALLRKAIPGLEPKFISVELGTAALMSVWVREDAPEGFTVDMDGEMKSATGGAIKFVQQSMTDKDVCRHLDAGYLVSKLAMTWGSAISFVATRDFVMTKLFWQGSRTEERAEDRESEFAAQMTMESGTLARLIADMIIACGGLRKPL